MTHDYFSKKMTNAHRNASLRGRNRMAGRIVRYTWSMLPSMMCCLALWLCCSAFTWASTYPNANGSWSGWSEVPGNGTTDVALAATKQSFCESTGAGLLLFAKGIQDQRIYVNGINDASRNWTGWSEVAGGGTTDVALAATEYQQKLFLFAKGINDRREYVNTFDGNSWTGWSEVPGGGTTDAALAVTVYQQKLFLFAKGINDRREYVNTLGGAVLCSLSKTERGFRTRKIER